MAISVQRDCAASQARDTCNLFSGRHQRLPDFSVWCMDTLPLPKATSPIRRYCQTRRCKYPLTRVLLIYVADESIRLRRAACRGATLWLASASGCHHLPNTCTCASTRHLRHSSKPVNQSRSNPNRCGAQNHVTVWRAECEARQATEAEGREETKRRKALHDKRPTGVAASARPGNSAIRHVP
ncbi:hypothetical protein FVE85_4984 [Porphyridium purpureum]|uniref:Uncharacterized protein n=1 Tax=Porphyridium purpureum TaxID=35688 RepID=A0A5J4YTV9_PORPP|nr:hypothetical protein FVE85_4984 [Porphyridium purpureum]|eukprot:POR1409..scf236_6